MKQVKVKLMSHAGLKAKFWDLFWEWTQKKPVWYVGQTVSQQLNAKNKGGHKKEIDK